MFDDLFLWISSKLVSPHLFPLRSPWKCSNLCNW